MYRYVKLSSTVYNAVVYLGNLSLIKTSRQERATLFKDEKNDCSCYNDHFSYYCRFYFTCLCYLTRTDCTAPSKPLPWIALIACVGGWGWSAAKAADPQLH